jgi:hypothetical protein
MMGLLFCAFVPCLALAEVRILGSEFEPADFVPGDRVVMVVRFDPGNAPWAVDRRTAGFPETSAYDPTILAVAIERRAGLPVLIVEFMPWKPGRQMLPSLSIAGLVFPPIPFEAATALTGDDSAPVPRPQLDPPGLRTLVYSIAGIALLLLLGSILFILKVRPWLARLRSKKRFRQVRDDLDRTLGELGTMAVQSAAAWAVLCAALRQFMKARTSLAWDAMTPSEIEGMVLDSPAVLVQADVVDILGKGDAVRFGGVQGVPLSAAADLASKLADRLDAAMADQNGLSTPRSAPARDQAPVKGHAPDAKPDAGRPLP